MTGVDVCLFCLHIRCYGMESPGLLNPNKSVKFHFSRHIKNHKSPTSSKHWNVFPSEIPSKSGEEIA